MIVQNFFRAARAEENISEMKNGEMENKPWSFEASTTPQHLDTGTASCAADCLAFWDK